MENDNWVLALLAAFGVLIAVAAGGAGYNLGKMNERVELTEVLVAEIEEAYWAGYGDATKTCEDNHK
jgi:hypothetical protein